ncbi:protein-L-isoaspartate(D-aspartate) O-methyltransferase [Salinicoccus jeotgali]|uniref:Protein-L-isoaspartate O-methyltransferase n=1 Tax=Salinicoccus jeotgali TaxID=381634 RepID=A0ABP7E908_9STAP
MKHDKKAIESFFNRLDRSRYMDTQRHLAGADMPCPIGHGQTISQPSLVLSMTLALELAPQHDVLEIGTGSGFQTAMLAKFSKNVYTVERIEALYERAKERLRTEGFSNIHFHYGDGNQGWLEYAPYDRIIVTAAAERTPQALVDQLAPDGKMVIPVGDDFAQELKLIEKDRNGSVHVSTLEYVRFVELKKDTE